jgi:hypothetical protein
MYTKRIYIHEIASAFLSTLQQDKQLRERDSYQMLRDRGNKHVRDLEAKARNLDPLHHMLHMDFTLAAVHTAHQCITAYR